MATFSPPGDGFYIIPPVYAPLRILETPELRPDDPFGCRLVVDNSDKGSGPSHDANDVFNDAKVASSIANGASNAANDPSSVANDAVNNYITASQSPLRSSTVATRVGADISSGAGKPVAPIFKKEEGNSYGHSDDDGDDDGRGGPGGCGDGRAYGPCKGDGDEEVVAGSRDSGSVYSGSILVIPRGECTFEHKVRVYVCLFFKVMHVCAIVLPRAIVIFFVFFFFPLSTNRGSFSFAPLASSTEYLVQFIYCCILVFSL